MSGPLPDYGDLYRRLAADPRLAAWAAQLPAEVATAFDTERNGNLARWLEALTILPPLTPSDCDFRDRVRIGQAGDCSDPQRATLEAALRRLLPWRKGPYELFGLPIDTEWRSDLKWQRVAAALAPLTGRRVLDVGCGSGYHLWRIFGAGAAEVVGIDPSLLFTLQFTAIKHYAGAVPVDLLPLPLEALPDRLQAFDTLFSMGVLYHRRSPIDHLLKLRDCLRPGGELLLETLVVEGDAQTVLLPGERYAKMRNVWFIPSPAQLILWLERCGYRDIQLVDVSRTSGEEQRRSTWMAYESLADFLDPNDPTLTVEGYPAPTRAVVVATAP